jgi:RNA polymerase sigma-70 factor (ECF subfamily)
MIEDPASSGEVMSEAGDGIACGKPDDLRAGWLATVNQMLGPVYRFVRARVPAEAVDDLVQETFAAASRGIGGFDGRCGLWGWLTAIARNKIAEYYRRTHSAKALIVAADALAEQAGAIEETIVSGHPLPEEICQRREFETLARAALSELSPEHRACLVARYYEDLSLDTLARHLGVSRAAANARLHRARQELKLAFVRLLNRPASNEEATI